MAGFRVVQVINDGHPLPAWVGERLAQAGVDFAVSMCWSKDDLARAAGDADLVWAYGGRDLLKGENLGVLPRCGAILRTGSGTDNVDVALATTLGIIVANTPYAITDSVADQAISLLFSLVRQVTRHDRYVHNGRWDFRLALPGRRFRGATLGLVGFGRIAQSVVAKLAGFGMRFMAYDPYLPTEMIAARGAVPASLEELLRAADYVSVHCPLTEQTRHLIGERELDLMRPHAFLVNTSRGAVVDEPALVRALAEGRIAGAGLDVLEEEPIASASPLLAMDNVIITPH
ncbi:MAG: C-terminal binding protein, partial [Anaerolineae bacterium]